ncbi:MAG: DsbA family protein [Alphaproteobacteria bacterium]|nr:DsbA family protein [Alphaproteobacteria bacterium]
MTLANSLLRFTAAVALISAPISLVGAPASADEPKATASGEIDRATFEKMLREFLEEHPEVVVEALESWRAQQKLAEEERAKKALVSESELLFRHPYTPVGGNPDGDVTIVEFFDYQCGYCKRVVASFLETVEDDGEVKVVFKEFPILGPASRYAAEAALASKAQGKYLEFHRALMEVKTALNPQVVMAVAKSVGLDAERLERDMAAAEVQDEIRRNFELAQKIGIRGTPAFIIGDHLVPGAIGADAMKNMIAEVRGRS